MNTLDIRTMMVMISAMTLLLSGLLALAGLHAGNIRGMRQWALASLCGSMSFGLAYPQLGPSGTWVVVYGALLMTAGMCLQFYGIKAFKGESCSGRMVLALVLLPVLVFAENLWLVMISPNVQARVVANSLVFAVINAASARALLVSAEQPLRTAYWLTGAAFAVQTVVLLVRAGMVWSAPPGSYGLYASMPINPVTFFIASVTQLCLTFGFVLMLNYRMAMDLQKLAARDVLTGALNRRSLETEFVRIATHHVRSGDALAVMLLDVDHFKRVNDTYGHGTGDQVLQSLAAVINNAVRDCDYFARYGGEEFCIVMPSTNEAKGLIVAERIRQACEQLLITANDAMLRITVSIGVADSAQMGYSFAALTMAADQAMYSAKRGGRNKVVGYSSVAA